MWYPYRFTALARQGTDLFLMHAGVPECLDEGGVRLEVLGLFLDLLADIQTSTDDPEIVHHLDDLCGVQYWESLAIAMNIMTRQT